MEDQFFLNAEIPPPSPPLHFEVEPMSAWYSLSELNYSQDCFLTQFDSALSSMASSPATSNSPFQDMPELVSFHDEPAESVLNPNAGPGSKASNSRKRKAETSATPSRIGRKMPDKNEEPNEKETKDYIHVRARRGEAADSHSLAERVRREKISERMKILQNLVPGCTKVIGKALVLDEIINYVRSLQSQVEFLSMELASVRIGTDFNADSMFHHSLAHPTDSSASAIFGQQNPELYSEVSNGTMVLV